MPLPLLLAGSTGLLAGAFFAGPRVMVAVFAATVLLALVWRLPGGADGFLRDVTATVFCLVYAPLLAGFVALLLRPGDGARAVLTFVIVTIASDIGGYAVGVLAGRHPMAPSISPKKSWEGFAGSTVSCVVAGALCVDLLLHGAWWVGVVLGALAVVAATLGDLVESLVKRDIGVKDMGSLLPGHGGMMDRLDSLLFCAPVVWAVLTFVLPHT